MRKDSRPFAKTATKSQVRNNDRYRPAPAGRGAPASRGPTSLRSFVRKDLPASAAYDFWPKDTRAVVGTHAINEVLKVRPGKIKLAWIEKSWQSSEQLRELEEQLRTHKVKVEEHASADLERLTKSHQGAALFMTESPELDMATLAQKEKSTIILLDGVEDPQNLGAILRSSWLFGVDAVLIPTHRASPLTASAHKIASGGAEHVPVLQVPNFSTILEELKAAGYWVFGFSHEAKQTLFQMKTPDKLVLALGAEDKGLRTTTERLCDELVSIPQAAVTASYNVSVATGIALAETYRQRLG